MKREPSSEGAVPLTVRSNELGEGAEARGPRKEGIQRSRWTLAQAQMGFLPYLGLEKVEMRAIPLSLAGRVTLVKARGHQRFPITKVTGQDSLPGLMALRPWGKESPRV